MQERETTSWREKYPLFHKLVCGAITLIGSIMIGAAYGVGFALIEAPLIIFVSAGGIWIIAALMRTLIGRGAILLGLFLGIAGAWGMWLGWYAAMEWPDFAAAREFGKLAPFEWPEHFSTLLNDRRALYAPFETWLIAWLWIFEIAVFLIAGLWGAWRGLKWRGSAGA